MLGVTTLLLGAGFYLTYFRKAACAPGEACAAPSRRLRRVNQVMLWLAAAVVVALAAFPHYAGLLTGAGAGLSGETAGLPHIDLTIEGMTCEACAVHIEKEQDVPGVRDASVDYDAMRATVAIDRRAAPATDELVRAVERAGYEASPLDVP